MKRAMEDLKRMLCDELDEIAAKGTLSAGDLETAEKLTCTIKNLYKIEMMDEGDYSSAGEWDARGSYGRNMYDRGGSYGRGRDSRGRYYSRAEGVEMIADRIKDMMSDATLTPADKASLKRAWDELQGLR